MPLDLASIIGHINQMAGDLDAEESKRRHDSMRSAWLNLDSRDVNQRYEGAKTSFLLAETTGDYRDQFPLPSLPAQHTVVAADGSFVQPDRHSPLRYYILNTGIVVLSYGDDPAARIEATPEIFHKESDLVVPNDPQRTPVEGAILGFRRAIAELRAAAEVTRDVDGHVVAMQDGTLVLWQLQGQSEAVKSWVLGEFLNVLDAFRERNQPVASYISAPGATELMNMLRVSICDYPDNGLPINCDDCRTRSGHVPACDILPSTTDRVLLEHIARLQPGERTTVYQSRSRILDAYDRDGSGDQRICFFYLNAGHEIGRVEIPRWAASDLDSLDLVHAVIYDQCTLGRGYPVALQEAHECAALSMNDRRIIEQAVERALAARGHVHIATGKDGSKRGRFV
jgi:hypothetical protein